MAWPAADRQSVVYYIPTQFDSAGRWHPHRHCPVSGIKAWMERRAGTTGTPQLRTDNLLAGFEIAALTVLLILSMSHMAFMTYNAYRSHSPITKSKLPRMAGTSLSMWPGRILLRMLRFTNEGLRIFIR